MSEAAPSRGDTLLNALVARIEGKSPADKDKLVAQVLDATKHLRMVPNPGPQTIAFNSRADQMFYGGEVAGGKTRLLCGLATEKHKHSLLMRRVTKEVEVLVDDVEDILKLDRKGYNSQKGIWRFGTRQRIQFGGAQNSGDEGAYKGFRKDLIGLDEASEFLESQVQFLLGWLGTKDPKQHCQLVLASNPPGTAEGQWIIRWFAPWLDPKHPRYPTPSGKLLWCLPKPGTGTGSDVQDFDWFDEPTRGVIGGRPVAAVSRTFIRAGLADNPDYADSGYGERLANMPDILRRRYLEGDFTAGMVDGESQLIPSAWILAAQERWRPDGGKVEPMTAMAIDPAGGGRDSAVVAARHGGWYAPLVSAVGPDTADGSAMAGLVVRHRRNNAPVVVDVGGGYGGGVSLRFGDNEIPYTRFNGSAASTAKTRDRSLGFANKRSEAWWKFMEELDPDQEGGSVVALPPDAELFGDLAAPRFDVRSKGIQVESKETRGPDGKVNGGIRKRLGRSPGKGDAVVMAMSEGSKARLRMADPAGYSYREQGIVDQSGGPQVVTGHQAVRRALGRR